MDVITYNVMFKHVLDINIYKMDALGNQVEIVTERSSHKVLSSAT